MKNGILLTTVFSAFDYDSCLQAFAGKQIIRKVGYECNLVKLKSLVKGRDVRFRKLMAILFRLLFPNKNNALKTYRKSYEKASVNGTEHKFFALIDEYLKPVEVSWRRLKSIAEEAVACLSGSDQIWGSSTLYVDPLYYSRFAPKQKRVTLSPSFRHNFVTDYNKNKVKKWIDDYPYLPVREDGGVKLIEELAGLEAQYLLDPTLIINSEERRKNLHIEEKTKDYILAYFLDEPSSHAKKALKALEKQLNCKVIVLPYKFEDMDYYDEAVATGPKEFVELAANAKVVCIDSFHGAVFALNLHIPFFTFEREYGFANKRFEHVLSILHKVDMFERYQPMNVVGKLDNLDFKHSGEVLNTGREKAYKYVNNATNSMKKNEK